MIGKQDILDRVQEWQLTAAVIEKDYVLGWVLAAIAQHSETSANWIFKGGTCLKKCYFETYRFSEDLDFTLLPESAYNADSLKKILDEVVEIAGELSGITFPQETVTVRARRNQLRTRNVSGEDRVSGPARNRQYAENPLRPHAP